MSSFRTEWENFHIITGDSKSPANVRKINFFYVLFNKNSNKNCFKGLNSIISTRNLLRKDALDPHDFYHFLTAFEQLTVNAGISDVNRFQYRTHFKHIFQFGFTCVSHIYRFIESIIIWLIWS